MTTARKQKREFRYLPSTYELPPSVIMQKARRVLAIDPGTVNCAVAVIEIDLTYSFDRSNRTFIHEKHDFRIVHAGYISNPITSMRKLSSHSLAFRNEVQDLTERFTIDGIAVERFQPRGFRGLTIECVNAMIGILSTIPAPRFSLPERLSEWTNRFKQKPLPMFTITAATWKNAFNREHDLDSLYKSAHSNNISPHIVDAVCLGIHSIRTTYLKRFNIDLPFPERIFSAYLKQGK